MKKYTLRELQQMETIGQGHTDNLKIKTEDTKVWLSRMTVEDGMPYNNMVTIEKLIDGKWETIEEYPAEVLYHNGATEKIANMIIRKVKNQTGLGYRENEILSNLAEVEQNNNVPEGYLQYIFYDVEGNGFQAGKDAYGNWGITL
jgi:hypothetical protein